jgi:lysophospholipase L1-like esterase
MTSRFWWLVVFLIGFLFVTVVNATTVSPSDPNLQFIGRWDWSDPPEPWAFAQGSSVIVSFTGSSISASFTFTETDYFRVIIDDNAAASEKITFSSGDPLSLASDLPAGTHKLELIKETDQGRATLTGFEIDDEESTVPSPPRPARKMVFYGDSNLAGRSLESERNQGGWHLVGSYYGFGGITARMFDAEYQNISRGGASITSLHTSYDRIDWDTNTPLWDFETDTVDVVVVNIGANDYWRPVPTNKNNYHSLLDDLREAYPAAHIMLYNSFGWESREPANYIHEVIDERDDPNMSSATFPWVFEQYHGCQTEHAGMAQYLAEHLTTVTGWTASEIDVVSGYGQNGNVANGSFEAVAPFGGWGWRYFDDPGVSRVFDPAGAHDGDYYLRLENGASSHQTNPANNGDEIAVSMWMRSADEGDDVDVSISFRDQDGGGELNDPIETETQTISLTMEWQRYTMTVTAPTDPPSPVFSSRVTFEVGAGVSADIDQVEIGVPSSPTGTLIPQNTPVIIPGEGGHFGFWVEITNPTPSALTGQVWTEAVLPNGGTYGPLAIHALTLPPFSVFSPPNPFAQNVPSYAPPGLYEFVLNVGIHPNVIIASDSFEFEKLASTISASLDFSD